MPKVKDYKWSVAGTSQFADLELTELNFRCVGVNYRTLTQTADLELVAREGNGSFKHSRTFSLSLSGTLEELGTAQITGAIGFYLFPDSTVTIDEPLTPEENE